MKKILTLLFVIFLSVPVYSQDTSRKIEAQRAKYIPLICEGVNRERSTEISQKFAAELERTRTFLITGFPDNNYFSSLIDTISIAQIIPELKRIGRERGEEVIIAGTVKNVQKDLLFRIYYIDVLSQRGDRIVSRLYSEDETNLDYFLSELALEMAAHSLDIRSTYIFFSSILLPGLGQITSGSKIRGVSYMAGFAAVFSLINYYGNGSDYNTMEYLSRIKSGDREEFMFMGNYISKDDYLNEVEKNVAAEQTRKDARKYRNILVTSAISLYFINLVDTFLILRHFDKRMIKKNMAFYSSFSPGYTEVGLRINLAALFSQKRW